LTSSGRKTLVLLPSLRRELKKPLGVLYKGSPEKNLIRLLKFLKCRETPLFAVVGDFSAKNILDSGLNPNIIVVDNRIMRNYIAFLNPANRRVINVKNPAGRINSIVWEALKTAVTLKSDVSVIVEGEEDLLVLPLISLMPLGSVIIYGQPSEGMVVLEVSKEQKRWTHNFLARMEEV
jgi:uncharacterized protein (UPF0218 family)